MSNSPRHLNILFLFTSLLLLVLPCSLLAAETTLEGRVFTEAGPLPAAKVYAYAGYSDIQSEKQPVAMATTDDKGVYVMTLKPGSYYFIARGEQDGRRFFAYHGANPIKLSDEKLWLGLLANPENKAAEY